MGELSQQLPEGPVKVWVPGRARTKGSLKPTHQVLGRGKCRVGLREDGEHSVPWKNTMIKAIRSACVCERWPRAVVVSLYFRFWREGGIEVGAPGESWPVGHQYGDIDKLTRNVLDALTQSALILDDALVRSVTATKGFAPVQDDRFPAGVMIEVAPGDE